MREGWESLSGNPQRFFCGWCEGEIKDEPGKIALVPWQDRSGTHLGLFPRHGLGGTCYRPREMTEWFCGPECATKRRKAQGYPGPS